MKKVSLKEKNILIFVWKMRMRFIKEQNMEILIYMKNDHH